MHSVLVFTLLHVALALAAGSDSDPWPELRVGTWNVMQQPWITEWTSVVNSHVTDNDLHVLHVVEVWTEQERDAILNSPKVKQQFPFNYSPTRRDERCGCNMSSDPELVTKIQTFLGCAAMYQIDPRQLIQPINKPLPFICQMAGMNIALHNYNNANFICLACVINVAQNTPASASFEQLVERVIGLCAMGVGDKYSYLGLNGQLILSKFPIRNVEETLFNGWLANRINIYATIRGVKMAFGHFAYNVIEEFDPSAAFLMYGDTQPQQALDMLAHRPDVIVGDLNTGPDYQSAGYNLLINGGYKSAFTVAQPQTYCAPSHANFPLCSNGNGGSFAPQSIDHILIRNCSCIRASNPQLFNDLPFMSDHIGVKAVISKRP